MKKMLRIGPLGIFSAFILAFLMAQIPASGVVLDEPESTQIPAESPPYHLDADHPADPTQEAEPDYTPGRIIVKLKTGAALADLEPLNQRFGVTSVQDLFPKHLTPQERLEALKQKRARLGSTTHSRWYWWKDKDSKEHREYQAKIEAERVKIDQQIQAQEELIARLERRQQRAPGGVAPVALDQTYLLEFDASDGVPSVVAAYEASAAVEYAEPDHVIRAFLVPNDARYREQWAHTKVQAERAWDITTGSSDVVIAIVDTGVHYGHEDLAANMWANSGETPGNGIDDDGNGYVDDVYGYDFYNYDGDPFDDYGHGTHCAGIAAAATNNSTGVAGAAWDCKIMAVKFLSSTGYGGLAGAVASIRYAVDQGADVISNSWGGGGFSETLNGAIADAYAQGVFLVASAGNSNSSSVHYPAGYQRMMSVAATDSQDQKASFSSYGSWVDVAAPGVGILSTVPPSGGLGDPSGYRLLNGTSMACPHLAGLAALLIGNDSTASNGKIAGTLASTADNIDETNPGFEGFLGGGRVNAYQALTATPHPVLRVTQIEPDNPLQAGATVAVHFSLANRGIPAQGIKATLTSSSPYVILKESFSSLGDLGWSDATTNEENPFSIQVLEDIPDSVDSIPFNLNVETNAGYTLNHSFELLVVTRYLKWVSRIEGVNALRPQLVDDLDNNGTKEIVLIGVSFPGENPGKLAVLDSTGQMLPGWPVNPTPSSGNGLNSAAAGDIDQDGLKEIIVTGPDSYGKSKVYAYRLNGTLLPGFPIAHPEMGLAFASLSDLDQDGQLEIVVTSQEFAGAYDWQGDPLPGWPVLDDHLDYYSSHPAVGDIDKDGLGEVAFLSELGGNDSRITVLEPDGSVHSGWPVEVSYISRGAPMAMADVDGDGRSEIMTTGGRSTGPGIHLYRENGSEMTFIPPPAGQKAAFIGQAVVPADLDGDGDLEVLAATLDQFPDSPGTVGAWHHDGTPVSGWPVPYHGLIRLPSSGKTSVVVGDIDADGDQEVILGSSAPNQSYIPPEDRGMAFLQAWHHDGTLVEGFPIKLPREIVGPEGGQTVITDLDGNGLVDLVTLRYTSHFNAEWGVTHVSVLEFPKSYREDSMEWPMFRHDPQRTGFYAFAPPSVPANRRPVLGPIGDKTVPEGESLAFTVTAIDLDGDELIFSAGNLPEGANFDPNTRAFTWIPTYEQSGFYDGVHFEVTDGELVNSETINITVHNVNRRPILDPIGDKEIKEGEPLEFTVTASDPDQDPIYLWIGDLPEGASFDRPTGLFSWTPDFTQADAYEVTFFASDLSPIDPIDPEFPLPGPIPPEREPIIIILPLPDSETITITVHNVNRPPVLDPIGDKEVKEGEPLEFTVTATDPDQDPIFFRAGNLPEGASFDRPTGRFSWTPDFTQADAYKVTFHATEFGLFPIDPIDPEFPLPGPLPLERESIIIPSHDITPPLSTSETINITVHNVNRPPVLDPIGDKEVKEGEPLEFTVTATDPDGDLLEFINMELPEGATFDWTPVYDVHKGYMGVRGRFYWTPDFSQADAYEVTFTANELGLIFLPVPDPFPPLPSPGTILADIPEVIDAPPRDITPPLSTSETINITVHNVNRPPVLDPIGDKEVKEGERLSFTVTASDPDSLIFLGAKGLPAGATFSRTGLFSWTPDFTQAGLYRVTFTATEINLIPIPVPDPMPLPNPGLVPPRTPDDIIMPPRGITPPLSDSETINITVVNVNRPPVLDPIGDKEVKEGEPLEFTVTATDPDGDPVYLWAGDLPEGASFDRPTGRFSWTPDPGQAGEYTVLFYAFDDAGLADRKKLAITVTNPVNRPPVLNPIANREIQVGQVYFQVISASDPDGDPLTFSAVDLPRFMRLRDFGEGRALVILKPGRGDIGEHTVTFSVSDGEYSASQKARVTVFRRPTLNRPPEIKHFRVRSFGRWALFRFRAIDPDGDSVRYHIDFGDGTSRSTAQHGTWHRYPKRGVYSGFLEAVDSKGNRSPKRRFKIRAWR